MQRITISLDETLGDELDKMALERGYTSRSEAMRDLVRDGLERWRGEQTSSAHCVASLSYIVDRRIRALPARLAEMQHANHDLVTASTVVRLDHYHSLETVILRGTGAQVATFANQVRSERGIRFGAINMLQVSATDAHDHAEEHVHHGHPHFSPL